MARLGNPRCYLLIRLAELSLRCRKVLYCSSWILISHKMALMSFNIFSRKYGFISKQMLENCICNSVAKKKVYNSFVSFHLQEAMLEANPLEMIGCKDCSYNSCHILLSPTPIPA